MQSGWNSVLTQHAVSKGRIPHFVPERTKWLQEHCGSIKTATFSLQGKKSLKCCLVILTVLQTGPLCVDILHVMLHKCGILQHWIWEERIGFEFLCDFFSTFYFFIVVNWEKSQSMENVWPDGFLCLWRKKSVCFCA